MSTLSSKLTRLETELNSIRTVSGLEGKVLEEIPVGIETKFTELNTTISERDNQITELNTQITTISEERDIAVNNVDSLNEEINEKTEALNAANARVDELTSLETELNNTIMLNIQTMEEQRATIDNRNAVIQEKNAIIIEKDTEISTLTSEIENLNHIINRSDVYEYITSADELNNYEHKDWKLYTVLEMTDCTPEMDSWVVQFPATFAPETHVTETFDCAVHDGYTVHVSPSEITINGPFFEAYGVTPIKYVSDGGLEYTRVEGPGVLHGADTGSKFTIQHPEAFNPILSSLIKCSTNKVKELYVSLNGEYHKVELAQENTPAEPTINVRNELSVLSLISEPTFTVEDGITKVSLAVQNPNADSDKLFLICVPQDDANIIIHEEVVHGGSYVEVVNEYRHDVPITNEIVLIEEDYTPDEPEPDESTEGGIEEETEFA